ncbi:MAG: FHA domain-containing protein [Polyangiaceae bacterium]|nr:FHA domain-containing protein [Polyangiaceae bacterium]
MTSGGFILEIGGRRLPLGEPRMVVGRDAGCDVVIEDPSVSSLHAHFQREEDGTWLLIDENSLNGTLLGGLRMRPGIPRLVTAGAEIRFGTVTAKVRLQIPVTAGVSTVDSAMAILQALDPSERGPSVHVVEGKHIGREILLHMDETAVVGRSPKADIVILDEAVSLRHLEVRRTPAGVLVRDVGSRHGTELAGRRLPLDDWSVWEPGLCLSLARSVVVLMLEPERTVDDIAVMSNPMVPKRPEPQPEQPEAPIPDADVSPPVASTRPQQADSAPMVPRPAPVETPHQHPPSSINALAWGGAIVFVLTAVALVWLLRG